MFLLLLLVTRGYLIWVFREKVSFTLESYCPREELVEITLENDVLKVDGNFAIAWSGSLDFTVERSGKSLIGSAAWGKVWLMFTGELEKSCWRRCANILE